MIGMNQFILLKGLHFVKVLIRLLHFISKIKIGLCKVPGQYVTFAPIPQ